MQTEAVRKSGITVSAAHIVEIAGKRKIYLIEETDVYISGNHPHKRLAAGIVAGVKHAVGCQSAIDMKQILFRILFFQIVQTDLLSHNRNIA